MAANMKALTTAGCFPASRSATARASTCDSVASSYTTVKLATANPAEAITTGLSSRLTFAKGKLASCATPLPNASLAAASEANADKRVEVGAEMLSNNVPVTTVESKIFAVVTVLVEVVVETVEAIVGEVVVVVRDGRTVVEVVTVADTIIIGANVVGSGKVVVVIDKVDVVVVVVGSGGFLTGVKRLQL